ncbi:FAD-containing oxidoreductase [Ancylobacter sp. WKF20]|uniref:FAD-containing oxidoreductase n=1 Tax=Ancylobacter sp. WKF20 TaxID=3039801 RepID=UPI00243417F3|nr:FAD-containing oxidoreductase [Ancylobacter sp. WKF20]WGD32128.1 FAD-containing oxidoreductase [Ancylobacter sp. WKF20]
MAIAPQTFDDSTFDAIIIGAGQAGPSLAGRLTGAGMKVAVIERQHFGGTCVNTGCKPTKTMVASAYAARMAQRAAEFGVVLAAPPGIDMTIVQARAGKIIADGRSGIESWLLGMKGCTVIRGHARFTGPHEVSVDGATLTAPRIFINVGGRASVPDLPGLADVPYLTNTDMVEMAALPEHLVIIGGSYIGLEFAQMFARFGARVTVIEKSPRLIAREDEDVSATVREILEAEGIEVHAGAEISEVAREGTGIAVQLATPGGRETVTGSHLLLAIGRRPNTDDLGLNAAGIATDARGYITVDDHLQTSVPGVYALGDCNGRGAFTHTAYNDFEIVAANLLDGQDWKVSERLPGYALYIDPPLGRVGMTETEARTTGRPLMTAKRPMTRVGRAVEKAETQGFMKVVADAQTGRILGAAILGTGGDEAIHGLLDAMNADLPARFFQRAVPIHPTVSELIPTLLADLRPEV